MSNANLSLGLIITNEIKEILLIKKNDEEKWHPCWCEIEMGESFKKVVREAMRKFFSVVGAEIGGVVFLGIDVSQRELIVVGGENSASILVRVIMQRSKRIDPPKGLKAKWFLAANLPKEEKVVSWLRQEIDLIRRIAGENKDNLLMANDLDPESFKITGNLLRQMK